MIKTQRLTLRRVEERDWQDIMAIWQDFSHSPMVRYNRPHDTHPEAVRPRIARWAACREGTEHMFYAVCLGERVIGYHAFNRRPEGYELGYCFHSDYFGQGYARESLSALLCQLRSIGAEKIIAGTAMENLPSRRLLEAMGFRLREQEQVSFIRDEDGNPVTFAGGIFERSLVEPPERAVVYVHGKGGNAAEAAHYQPLFPHARVIGLEYQSRTPEQAAEEFPRLLEPILARYGRVSLIANSIGACFCLHALGSVGLSRAWLISPMVEMEQVIQKMMEQAGVSEEELRRRGEIDAGFGEPLSWDYLCYVREHSIRWTVPTRILRGEKDTLISGELVAAFARRIHAPLTVMPGGEHWFHTPEQMAFLDQWMQNAMDSGQEENGDGLQIRKAVPEDAEELLDFLRQVGGETDNLGFGPEGLPISPEAERRFIASQLESETDVMLVVRQDGRIIATGSFNGMTRKRMKHRGQIALSVAKSHWGRGVGTRLMEALLEFARRSAHVEIISLEVRCDNARAIALYERFGFRRIGTFPGFFKIDGKPVDFHLMNLYLTPDAGK